MSGKSISVKAGAVLVSLLAALVVAAPSASGERGSLFQITTSKKADGNYDSFSEVKVKKGEKKFIYFKATNNTGSTQDLTLTDGFTTNPNPDGYKILWYEGFEGRVKITIDVKGAGYNFQLPPFGTAEFRARINHKSSGPKFCGNAQISDGMNSSNAYFGVNTDLCVI